MIFTFLLIAVPLAVLFTHLTMPEEIRTGQKPWLV